MERGGHEEKVAACPFVQHQSGARFFNVVKNLARKDHVFTWMIKYDRAEWKQTIGKFA